MTDGITLTIPIADHQLAIVVITIVLAFSLYGMLKFIEVMRFRTLIPDLKYWYTHRQEFNAWRERDRN